MNDDFKELQEFVNFLFDVVDAAVASKADGVLNLADLQYVPTLFFSAQRGINGLGNPAKRWKDLPDGDRVALRELAKTRFDLSDDQLEALFERWFDAGVIVAELVADTVAFARRDDVADAG